MRFMTEYPLSSDREGGAWLDPGNMTSFAQAVEAAGLDAISLTDHPAPSKKWLEHGGHETLDPFVGLGFFAAATERILLMTHLVVVPYRNPLLLAKSMTSVDVLSGGRTTYILGTGYLRSEFGALGVDFDERNELFDEAVEVLEGIWSTDDFHFEGRHFTARGQIVKPGPVQQPHPPLWLGGNAAVVRERVAAWGQGWAPLQGGAQLSRTARTPAIEGEDGLATMLADLDARLSTHGRSRDDIEVMASAPISWDGTNTAEYVDALGHLADLGIGWTAMGAGQGTVDQGIERLHRFGDEVIRQLG